MANVRQYLQDILDAIYGEEVRGSIHDAIEAMNEESTNAEAVAISSRDSAKHSAEAAEESATEAAASETAAKTSETNAKASETAAKASETAAKASETAAKRSENNASDSEDAAYESEQTAKASENAAKDSEDAAASSASAARTYSMQAFEYKHDAQESAEAAHQYELQCEQIRDDIGYPIDPKGTVTFANLPSVATAQIGWLYNVSDDFTTTSDFEEGAGKFYSAGSEVYVNSNHKWSVMAGPGVTGIKGEAESTYHKGQVKITKSMLGINTLDDIDTPTFTQAATRTNINTGETVSTILGKIKKFFADLKTVAFTGNASDVSFDPTGTTSSATTVQAGLNEALTNSAPTASDVPYDNTASGLSATDVQGAIDEVVATKQIANGLLARWSSAQALNTSYNIISYGPGTNYSGGVAVTSLLKGKPYKLTITGTCANVTNNIDVVVALKTANTTSGVDTDMVCCAIGSTKISGTSFTIETELLIPKTVSPTYCQYWFKKSSSSTTVTINSIYAKWEEIGVYDAIKIGDDSTQSRISNVETKGVSSQAYSIGQYFTHGDKLKRVTSAIASGNNISSSNTEDTTIGEELSSRAFMNRSVSANEPADMNNIVQIGTHSINPEVTTLNTPNSKWGYVEVFYHGTGGIVQLWTDTDNESMYIRTKSGNPLVWSDWKVYAQSGYNIRLTSENLDDVVTPGKYFQGNSANCTVARNYPIASAGYLEVETMSDNVVIQTYHPSATSHHQVSFQRRRYNGTWEAWGSDDWISLLQVPGQITIPTTGYSITLNHSVFNRCRQKRIITFGVNELPQNGFSSNGTYAAYNFMVNSNSYYVLRWENMGTSPNACKLYYYVNGTATQIATGNAAPLIQGILGNRGNYVTYQLSK